jgi:hypothetical protein
MPWNAFSGVFALSFFPATPNKDFLKNAANFCRRNENRLLIREIFFRVWHQVLAGAKGCCKQGCFVAFAKDLIFAPNQEGSSYYGQADALVDSEWDGLLEETRQASRIDDL